MALLALGGCYGEAPTTTAGPAAAPPPSNVHEGGGACADCHAEQASRWAASHHAKAQSSSVLASRFDGVTRVAGNLRVTPRVAASGPVFVVSDAAGTTTYAATGTIGVAPLQQYLVDGPRGRRLVAPIAYDVAREQWFDPAADGAQGNPDDPLYWAGIAGTWNHQCAACHTTGFTKAYEPATDTYTSTWAADGVTCGACHGPSTSPRALATAEAQLDACAGCHSLRRALTCADDGAGTYLDRFRPALGDSGAFGPDGRPTPPIESFEWGTWSQSRMAAAGVRCTDCHDAHASEPRPGDDTCVRCHASGLDGPDHAAKAGCVTCHMPTANYMGIHARHDHRVTRPGHALNEAAVVSALAGEPAAPEGLLALAASPRASAFERATAIALLRRFPPAAELVEPLRLFAAERSALVRTEAVATLGVWGDARTPLAALADPVRSVRFAAVEAYVAAGGNVGVAGPAFHGVLAEVERVGACDDDLPGTHQDLGRLRAATGDRAGAVAAFQTLLKLDPGNEVGTRALKLLGVPQNQ